MSLLQLEAVRERPTVVTLLICISFASALLAAGLSVLLILGAVSLSSGAFLLGGGMEQLGPVAFVLYAIITAILGWGMLLRRQWARRFGIVLAVAGIAVAVPAISSAVVDGRAAAIAREGMQIIVRVVIVYWLVQEPVREWFA